jgi:hypothetical protein
MRKYLTIYEEAGSHIWLCNFSILNFLSYEDFFLSMHAYFAGLMLSTQATIKPIACQAYHCHVLSLLAFTIKALLRAHLRTWPIDDQVV